MPYQVKTNSQGLRMNYDLKFPKLKQRILILGDSYTFGVFHANHDTYPALLGKKMDESEVINAGVSGYTITDELSLYKERAKYIESDIIILQVLDNDIYGLMAHIMNVCDRNRRVYSPTEIEKKFLQLIR